MKKYLLYYIRKNNPYFWQLQTEGNSEPIAHFKSRHDAINFYIANRIEGSIIFQDSYSIFVGAIVSKKANEKMKYQIKIAKLQEIITLEDKEVYKSSLANEFQINLLTNEDALSLVSRKNNYSNTFILYRKKTINLGE
ncbi:hypothetical protein [[Mycoplasma] mobile]|uniref:Expressed protein n=1 Tax=Mycoplasma mobile (strain ATCC 43663 / 163K / NCTC 11711) TaxID=267748 RepID=Q6KHA0_MYCM1|nr:hypothetical protein [[Mycoplasma] mobile]AAT28030.1 expressed protein [Mycoplasma mobile 163K]